MNICRIYPWYIITCITIGLLVPLYTQTSLANGFFWGICAGMLPMTILGVLYLILIQWSPDRPRCICGKCSSNDYQYVDQEKINDDLAFHFICPFCTREYRSCGGKFELKTKNGLTPYMEMTKWRRWGRSSKKPPPLS